MVNPRVFVFVLPCLLGCATSNSPQPSEEGEQTILHDLAALDPLLGVWTLEPPEAKPGSGAEPAPPVSGSLRIFPTFAGTFVEGYAVYRYENGATRVMRQFWTRDAEKDRYRMWGFADGGSYYSGVLEAQPEGGLSGSLAGVDRNKAPLQGRIALRRDGSQLIVDVSLAGAEGERSSTTTFRRSLSP